MQYSTVPRYNPSLPVDVTDLIHLLSIEGKRLRFLERKHGVSTVHVHTHNKKLMYFTGWVNIECIENFLTEIFSPSYYRILRENQYIFNKSYFKINEWGEIKFIPLKINLYLDESNIVNGTKFNGIKNFSMVRLLDIVEHARFIDYRYTAGSTNQKDAVERIRSRWKNHGFDSNIEYRPQDSKELFVDELIISAISVKLLADNTGMPQHIILLTGDGNQNNNRPLNFPKIIISALEKGWTVELWTWKSHCSKYWYRITDAYKDKFTINYLDVHKKELKINDNYATVVEMDKAITLNQNAIKANGKIGLFSA